MAKLNAEKSNAGIFTYYAGLGKTVKTVVSELAYLKVVTDFVATPTKSFANYITDLNSAKTLSDNGSTYDTIAAALKTDSYVRLINGIAGAQITYPKQAIVMSSEPELPATPSDDDIPRPVVRASVYTTTNKHNSDEFASRELAMHSCPHKTQVCKKRKYYLSDTTQKKIEVEIENFTSADSCHYLVKVECGLPVIQMSDQWFKHPDQLRIDYLEYQQGVGGVLMSDYYEGYPAKKSVPHHTKDQYLHPEGTLGYLRKYEVIKDVIQK